MASRTILLVDGDRDSIAIYSTALRHFGFRVLTADTGSEGLRLALTEVPDLVISELLIPEMDGETLVERLAVEPATRGVPLLMLSSVPLFSRARRELGCNAFLMKPCAPTRLLREVHRLLEIPVTEWPRGLAIGEELMQPAPPTAHA